MQQRFLIKALTKIIAGGMPTVTIPKGSILFHGSIEKFSGGLKPGIDGLIWFADSPKIAQLYIPMAGLTMYVSPEHVIKPDKDKNTQLVQKMLGIEYDMSKVEWDGHRLKSWPSPKGWEKLPKEKDIDDRMVRLGYKKDSHGYYALKVANNTILGPNEVQKGRLLIAKVKEPLKVWKKSEGEGDQMNVQYHDISGFKRAKAEGLDGVLIDDFAQSKEYGNFGHLSVGLFDTKKLSVTSVEAQYREWEYKNKGTPEYPNAPEMFFSDL
jgi:hypothetical protein